MPIYMLMLVQVMPASIAAGLERKLLNAPCAVLRHRPAVTDAGTAKVTTSPDQTTQLSDLHSRQTTVTADLARRASGQPRRRK